MSPCRGDWLTGATVERSRPDGEQRQLPNSLVFDAISTLGPNCDGKICTSPTFQSFGSAGMTIAVAARISSLS